MLEKYMQDVIKLAGDTINKTDEINKRLVTAVVVMTIAFSLCFTITVVGITYLYFTSDYTYPVVNQNQINADNSNQSINKGVK